MANTARRMAGIAMAAVIVSTAAAVAATVTASDESPNARVRSGSAAIVALIERANGDSATFRRLVHDVNASDGIVYVQEGVCPDAAHACFVNVTMAGSSRALWVRVNLKMRNADWDVMGSIAHELSHTLEVLAAPSVTSGASMQSFYRAFGFRGSARGYETWAAVDAGNAVRDEVRASIRRSKAE